MSKRMMIHQILCDLMECETEGDGCRCHFQPPSNIRMKYPAIVYELSDISILSADNKIYHAEEVYILTLIDKNPDSKYLERLKLLPKINFSRFNVYDNLNHWVFTIY